MDIDREPEKSYMSEFEEKVDRAMIRKEIQLEQENETNTRISQEDAEPAGKFLILTKARRRDNQEAALTTAIQRMELDLAPENVHIHVKILHSMLRYLERIHQDFIKEQSFSTNLEPDKYYMLKIEGKVSRALKRQRIKLQMHTPALPIGKQSQQQYGETNAGTTTVKRTENLSGSPTSHDVASNTTSGDEGLAETTKDQ